MELGIGNLERGGGRETVSMRLLCASEREGGVVYIYIGVSMGMRCKERG